MVSEFDKQIPYTVMCTKPFLVFSAAGFGVKKIVAVKRANGMTKREQRLGIKKKRVSFVLRSTFRNIGSYLPKLLRLGNERENAFLFAFLSTFRNFAAF